MFVVGDEIYINELAPRPHNSGHYTLDACITSQFEQHIRAVCGLPLGETTLHTPVVMVNILGDHMDQEQMDNLQPYMPLLPKGKLHLYGKAEAKLARKMGHINLLGNVDESIRLADATKIWRG
jgi:5-(carboxyamino)imidazole ribonucleotide synthase